MTFLYGSYYRYGEALSAQSIAWELGDAAWQANATHYLNSLVQLNMNCTTFNLTKVTNDPRWELWFLNQAHARGIKVLRTVGNPANPSWDQAGPTKPFHPVYTHPAVIGYKYGDEPDTVPERDAVGSGYGSIRAHYPYPTKGPCVTAMIGELIEAVGVETWVTTECWDTWAADVRLVRHYPIRRDYDLLTQYTEANAVAKGEPAGNGKMVQEYQAFCAAMEQYAATPWWFIPQWFGRNNLRLAYPSSDSYWRYPIAAEVEAHTHVALSHGCRGIFGFAGAHWEAGGYLQEGWYGTNSVIGNRLGEDGSNIAWAIRKIGRYIKRNDGFFTNHVADGTFTVTPSTAEVYATARKVGAQRYIYATNLDCANANTSVTLATNIGGTLTTAQDIFTGSNLTISGDDVICDFNPGQGRLIRIA